MRSIVPPTTSRGSPSAPSPLINSRTVGSTYASRSAPRRPASRTRGAATVSRTRVTPAPVQRGGPPVWIAAMRPRAIALAARCADGWEASFLPPAAFGNAAAQLDAALAMAGRPRDGVRRSVEVDAALLDAPAPVA